MILDAESFFDLDEAETTILVRGSGSQAEYQAMWNFDNDPLFSDRAAGTQINFLIPSENITGIAQNDIAIRANGDRYKIRSYEPTCGDGLLTVVNVIRE